MYVVSKSTQIEGPYMVSTRSFAFTGKTFEDILRRLKEALRTSPGKRLGDVFKRRSSRLPFQTNTRHL